MRALVFNPYMNALGGGERYALAFAQALMPHFEVDVAGPFVPDRNELLRLGLVVPKPLQRLEIRRFTEESRKYDLTVQVSNYWPLFSRAGFSAVVVQFPHGPFNWRHPLRHRHGRRMRDEAFVTYSEFSRSWCGPRWGVDATVVPPPVELDTEGAVRPQKLPRILAVGRFFRGGHTKRFDALVEAFRSLPDDIRSQWELVLVGGTRERSSAQVVQELKSASRGLNVRVLTDASREELRELYRGSSLYWQATGYGRPPNRPERAEHFGIALVEAMSYGCVPLAYRDGGAPEITEPIGASCLWTTLDELGRATADLLSDDPAREERARLAVRAAQRFSYEAFETRVSEFVRSRMDD
jgi:glycosyltransferase involved in cell wall biosynthesis